MKMILVVFFVAFVLNAIWENLHSFLYDSYRDGPITELILFRATLADAIMIAVIAAPFLYFPSFKKYRLLAVVVWIVVAILIEIYALSTGRWMYNEYMPLIPLLGIGFTPTIQLALLGFVSLKIEGMFFRKSDRASLPRPSLP